MPANATLEVAENLVSHEISEEAFAEGGEYLPLGVWAIRGFDIGCIEQKTRDDDKRVCPVLGLCYRLRIVAKTNLHRKGTTRESKRQKTAPEAAEAAPAANSADERLALEDGRASSSSSSSSSSSDSSSNDSRRHKKSKKDSKKNKKSKKTNKKDKKSKKSAKDKKKNKKDKGKEMSAADKNILERENKADVKAADVLVSKLEPAIACLIAMVAKPNFMHIAPAIKDPLIALQIKFEELMSQAQAVQVSGSGKIDADVKTLAQDLATYRKQYQLATSMLGLMERGSRRPV